MLTKTADLIKLKEYPQNKHVSAMVRIVIDLVGLQGMKGHVGTVVRSELESRPRPQVGKLVVACRWSPVHSTEP